MVNTISDRLDMPIEHGSVGLQSCGVNFSLELEPAIRIAFVRTDHRARGFAKDLGAASGARIQSRFDQLLNDIFVAHLVKVREVVKLNHRKSLQVQLRKVALQRRQQIGKVTERKLG